MALDRFTNEEVLGYTPVIGETLDSDIKSKVEKQDLPIGQGEVDNFIGFEEVSNGTEIHVYSDSNLLESSYDNPITYTGGSNPKVYVKPEQTLRDLGISQGAYSVVYNFLKKVSTDLKVDAISSDRTEIRLVSNNGTSDVFRGLRNLYSTNSQNSFTKGGVHKDFVLNFGNDELYDVLNVAFDGVRVGSIVETLPYPTGTYTQDGVTYPTVFVPFDDRLEEVGVWRTLVEVIAPAVGSSNSNVGKLTGRARSVQLQEKINNNQGGELTWNLYPPIRTLENDGWPSDVTDNFLNPLTLTAQQMGLSNLNLSADYTFNINFNNLNLNYNRYDNSISEYDVVILKLSKPLSGDVTIFSDCEVSARLMRSIVEKIVVFPSIEEESVVDFSQPNFKLDVSDGNTSGTTFRSWETLLDVNATTQNELVQTYLSSSFGDIKLNIDYSDFSNFVHFSSATERVDNFKYKLEQIETYDERIELLESVSGSDALTNISQSIVRKNRILNGFDEFERYLYHSNDPSNYTHWSSSNHLIEPYPKVSTYPHVLRGTTSSEGVSWYNGVYASASLYDSFNDARLRNMIPVHLQEDERNGEYITFIDMIGQHFDVQWTYIKSLTNVNRREEHPKDGLADELLQSVAESLGWKLSNGYTDVELWKYALGVESDGTLYQTGSLQSKSREQIVHETWRRIVNTIPMMYKTKGSARSIKALLSTYGIPQSFLQIREYGGPTVSTRKNIYEHERFVNKLEVSATEYLTNPWGDFEGATPESIEIIIKPPTDDFNIAVLESAGNDYNLVWDYNSTNKNGRLVLKQNDSSTVLQTERVPYVTRRDIVITINSSSSGIGPLQFAQVDDFGDILSNEQGTFALPPAETAFNNAWGSLTGVVIGGGSTTTTGSFQEVRYYSKRVNSEILEEHAKNREAYFIDDNTTDLDVDTAFDTLLYRIFPDSGFNTNSSSIDSIHPNQEVTQSDGGAILSASISNMTPSNLVGEVDTMFQTIPSVGALNLMNNKVRIESASLVGELNPDKSQEVSQFDYAPNDSNILGTYFSTTDTINNDIYNSEGYFEADDWVGDPDKRYNENYPMLRYKMKNYFQKYTGKTAIGLILDILSRYDMSVFDQMKQLIPARVDWRKGILIEPHVLERSKFQRPRDITISQPSYEGTLDGVVNVITGSYDVHTSSIDLYDYQPSVYLYESSSGDNYTYSNGYWEYSPTGSTILNARKSTQYQIVNLFFSTEESASLNLPSSSSFEYAEVQDTRYPLSIENLYFNGCKVTSDSLTTDSPDTPDGGPAVVVTEADPTVLVVSTEQSDIGGLNATDSPNTPNVIGVMPVSQLIATDILQSKKDNQSKVNKANELRTMRPLPFIPKTNKPKKRLRVNRSREILRTIRKRNNIQK